MTMMMLRRTCSEYSVKVDRSTDGQLPLPLLTAPLAPIYTHVRATLQYRLQIEFSISKMIYLAIVFHSNYLYLIKSKVHSSGIELCILEMLH